jgi:hypothetical protein
MIVAEFVFFLSRVLIDAWLSQQSLPNQTDLQLGYGHITQVRYRCHHASERGHVYGALIQGEQPTKRFSKLLFLNA